MQTILIQSDGVILIGVAVFMIINVMRRHDDLGQPARALLYVSAVIAFWMAMHNLSVSSWYSILHFPWQRLAFDSLVLALSVERAFRAHLYLRPSWRPGQHSGGLHHPAHPPLSLHH